MKLIISFLSLAAIHSSHGEATKEGNEQKRCSRGNTQAWKSIPPIPDPLTRAPSGKAPAVVNALNSGPRIKDWRASPHAAARPDGMSNSIPGLSHSRVWHRPRRQKRGGIKKWEASAETRNPPRSGSTVCWSSWTVNTHKQKLFKNWEEWGIHFHAQWLRLHLFTFCAAASRIMSEA